MIPPYDHVLDYVDDLLQGSLSAHDANYVNRHCQECPICKVALEEAHKRAAAFTTLPIREASEQVIQRTLQRVDAHERRMRRVRRIAIPSIVGALAASLLLLSGFHIYYANLKPSPYDLRILGQVNLFQQARPVQRRQSLN